MVLKPSSLVSSSTTATTRASSSSAAVSSRTVSSSATNRTISSSAASSRTGSSTSRAVTSSRTGSSTFRAVTSSRADTVSSDRVGSGSIKVVASSNRSKVANHVVKEKGNLNGSESFSKDCKSKPKENTSNTTNKTKPLPSTKLNKHVQANPWGAGSRKHVTNFGSVYTSGGIPCSINHGSIKHSLRWDIAPETLNYDPLLVTCCEGLLEIQHPYVFVARQAFQELIEANGSKEKVIPILPKLVHHIRMGLLSKSDDIFSATLHATCILSKLVKDALNEHLTKLLSQIHRKLLDKAFQEKVTTTLHTLEENGGPESFRVIKTKVPTYVSINM